MVAHTTFVIKDPTTAFKLVPYIFKGSQLNFRSEFDRLVLLMEPHSTNSCQSHH